MNQENDIIIFFNDRHHLTISKERARFVERMPEITSIKGDLVYINWANVCFVQEKKPEDEDE